MKFVQENEDKELAPVSLVWWFRNHKRICDLGTCKTFRNHPLLTQPFWPKCQHEKLAEVFVCEYEFCCLWKWWPNFSAQFLGVWYLKMWVYVGDYHMFPMQFLHPWEGMWRKGKCHQLTRVFYSKNCQKKKKITKGKTSILKIGHSANWKKTC